MPIYSTALGFDTLFAPESAVRYLSLVAGWAPPPSPASKWMLNVRGHAHSPALAYSSIRPPSLRRCWVHRVGHCRFAEKPRGKYRAQGEAEGSSR